MGAGEEAVPVPQGAVGGPRFHSRPGVSFLPSVTALQLQLDQAPGELFRMCTGNDTRKCHFCSHASIIGEFVKP